MRQYSIISYITWSFVTLASGGAFVAAPFLAADYIASLPALSFDRRADADSAPDMGGETVVVGNTSLVKKSSGTYTTRVLSQAAFSIPAEGSAVFADLAEMMIRTYRDGELVAAYPIVSKGKPGSLWETPTGAYAIRTKEENHYSTIGDVWMPYSMQFFGNFFIHGWPYYADGTPAPEGYSGGCIRLSTEDAAQLFSELEIGTPVFVAGGTGSVLSEADEQTTEEDYFGFAGVDSFVPPPAVSGQSVMVGDLESGFIFFEKNPEKVRSLASLSKLMTALISVEAVNQFTPVVITSDDVAVEGTAGGFRAGDRLETGELLWPLLLASSNDAAYAIARQIGLGRFVDLMNQKAGSLGLRNTAYKEPSGLDPANRSTALDMFRFVQHVWSNKRTLLNMTEQRSYKTWRNIHPFVSKDSFAGGKTGYIPEAKRTVVAVFSIPFGEFATRPVAIVVLGSDNIRSDVDRLRLWVKNNFQYDLQKSRSEGARVEYDVRDLSDASTSLSLLFTGDIMMDRGVAQVTKLRGGGDWAFPFQYVAGTLRDADLTFGNLEGPLSDKGTNAGSTYSFRMDPQVASVLADVGFDVVSMANNHAGDWNRAALEDTMRRLLRAGVAYAGAGWNSVEAAAPAVLEVRGVRVGYLAFSDVGPRWLSAQDAQSGVAALPSGEAGVSYVQNSVFEALRKADIVVVSFHFGEEYQDKPTARQRLLSRAAIDAGARVVAGHHPHVIQTVEEYKNGVIAYSLGNFIFDQNFSAETMEGLMLRVEFHGDAITAVVPIPVRMNEYYQPEVE